MTVLSFTIIIRQKVARLGGKDSKFQPSVSDTFHSMLSIRYIGQVEVWLQICADVEIHAQEQFSITSLSDAGDSSAQCGCRGLANGEQGRREIDGKERKGSG